MVERIDLSLTVKAITKKALLLTDGDRESWVPKSLIEWNESNLKVGQTVDFDIPEWIATQNEWV